MHSSWKQLLKEEDLNIAIENSYQKPCILFKDSKTCGISASAKHRLETNFETIQDKVDFYYLDLLQYRSISNLIAEKLNVIHQSPQIIVLKNGEVIHHSSHYAISVDKIAEAIL